MPSLQLLLLLMTSLQLLLVTHAVGGGGALITAVNDFTFYTDASSGVILSLLFLLFF